MDFNTKYLKIKNNYNIISSKLRSLDIKDEDNFLIINYEILNKIYLNIFELNTLKCINSTKNVNNLLCLFNNLKYRCLNNLEELSKKFMPSSFKDYLDLLSKKVKLINTYIIPKDDDIIFIGVFSFQDFIITLSCIYQNNDEEYYINKINGRFYLGQQDLGKKSANIEDDFSNILLKIKILKSIDNIKINENSLIIQVKNNYSIENLKKILVIIFNKYNINNVIVENDRIIFEFKNKSDLILAKSILN